MKKKVNDWIKWRVGEMIKVIDNSPAYQDLSADEIVKRIGNKFFSDDDVGVKEKELLIKTLKDRRSSLVKKDNDNDDIVYWDEMLVEMKNDFGKHTDISKTDFRYITNWLKNKVGRKTVHI